MARIRYIKPDFFKDEDLAELPFETRLFFAGLWTQADKEGRLEDRPKRLKVELMPYDNADIEKMLQELANHKKDSGCPFIMRYEVNGQRYIQILAWKKHQRPHHTEKISEIPPAPPLMEKGMGKGKEKGMGMVKNTTTENQLNPSSKLNNGEISVIYNYKTFKEANNLEFKAHLKAVYPEVNIELEFKKMELWLQENPDRRYKNYGRFAGNWVSRLARELEKSQEGKPKIRKIGPPPGGYQSGAGPLE